MILRLISIFLLFCFSSISAVTINVPAEYSTIQSGINAANTNDTVLVAQGTYIGTGNRDISFGGKNIVLLSLNGPTATTIDCGGSELNHHIGFIFNDNEDSSSVINGFTITNAFAGDPMFGDSAAIICESSSPTIQNCIIRENQCNGVRSRSNAFPYIIDCVIKNNSQNGILVADVLYPMSNIYVFNCVITNNGMSGIYLNSAFIVEIRNCTIVSNKEDGILLHGDPPKDYKDYTTYIYNCITAFNGWNGINRVFFPPQVEIYCTDSYGNGNQDWQSVNAFAGDANGNISVDPLFCDTVILNYNLRASSPCLPENNDCNDLIGAPSQGCNLCGDNNEDGGINISDIVYLINCIFSFGPCPDPAIADVDCSGVIDISDAVYLLNYIFAGGPAPCAGC